MKKINIHEAKTNLSRYLAEPMPVPELRSLRKKAVRKPRVGAASGEFEVSDSFFDPLPDEILRAFAGKS